MIGRHHRTLYARYCRVPIANTTIPPLDRKSQQDTDQEKQHGRAAYDDHHSPKLIPFCDRGESRQSQHGVINANAHNPARLLFLAINHFAQETIVIIVDRHKRGVSERLVEPDLGPALAYVSDLTVKNLASFSQHAHASGLI